MRPRIFALLAVSAFALTGCSTAETSEQQPTVSVTAVPSASVESVSGAPDGDPELFLKSINFRWIGEQQFSETELLDAGRDACKQLRDGVDILEVESELPGISDENQDALAVAGQDGFCPETGRGALKPSEIPDPIAPASN